MNNLQKIKVEETGKRIDAFLTSKIDASRVTVQRLIDEERILVKKQKHLIKFKMEI